MLADCTGCTASCWIPSHCSVPNTWLCYPVPLRWCPEVVLMTHCRNVDLDCLMYIQLLMSCELRLCADYRCCWRPTRHGTQHAWWLCRVTTKSSSTSIVNGVVQCATRCPRSRPYVWSVVSWCAIRAHAVSEMALRNVSGWVVQLIFTSTKELVFCWHFLFVT